MLFGSMDFKYGLGWELLASISIIITIIDALRLHSTSWRRFKQRMAARGLPGPAKITCLTSGVRRVQTYCFLPTPEVQIIAPGADQSIGDADFPMIQSDILKSDLREVAESIRRYFGLCQGSDRFEHAFDSLHE